MQIHSTLPPHILHLSRLNSKHVWRGYTPIGVCMACFNTQLIYASQRSMQKKGKATSGYLYQKFYPSANTSSFLATAVPGLHLWDWDVSTLWRECRSLHWRWSSGYESMLRSCNLPILASRRPYMKLCVLYSYQIVNGCLNFHTAPTVPWNLSCSPRNTNHESPHRKNWLDVLREERLPWLQTSSRESGYKTFYFGIRD